MFSGKAKSSRIGAQLRFWLRHHEQQSQSVQAQAPARIRDHRISGAFAFDGEELLEILGGVRALESLVRQSLVVKNGRIKMVAGHIVQKNRGRFPSVLHANVKLRGRLRKSSHRQIRAAEIEMR